MVACDHANIDTSLVRDPDRLLRRGSQRIDDADERNESEILDERHRISEHCVFIPLVDQPERKGENPEPLGTQPFVRSVDAVDSFADRHPTSISRRRLARPFQHDIRCTLGEENQSVLPVDWNAVHRGHEFVTRVEGNLCETRPCPTCLFGIYAYLGSKHDEGSLCWITDDVPIVAYDGVRVEHER